MKNQRLIIEVIEECIRTDEESPENKEYALERAYAGATPAHIAKMDEVLMALTGWRFETLEKMAKGEL